MMKKIYPLISCVIALCLSLQVAQAQQTDSLKNQLQQLFYQYRLIYPNEALTAGVEGNITLKFDLTSDCDITNVRQDTVLGHGTEVTVKESLDLVQKNWASRNNGKCEEIRDLEVLLNFQLR